MPRWRRSRLGERPCLKSEPWIDTGRRTLDHDPKFGPNSKCEIQPKIGFEVKFTLNREATPFASLPKVAILWNYERNLQVPFPDRRQGALGITGRPRLN